MHTFFTLSLLSCVTLLLLVATTTNQVFAKNICTSTLPAGEHPNWIGQANFQHMTNRGMGNYNVSVLLCWASLPPDSCGLNPSYIAITNESAGCVGNFDVVLQRPTVAPNGFKVKYGSKTSPRDMAEIMVVCNPNVSAIPLISRSQKFAKFSPNKLGGTTFMMVTYSYAACATNQPTSTTATQLPTTELPSGGSSDMPSGGSGSMPSGGSGSMPSGGSMSGSSGMPPFPSGGSGSMPSGGSGSMPSGGSGSSDMPSGGSGSMPMPSGGSGSGEIPSGGSGSGYIPSGGSDPVSWSDSKPDSNDTPPPIPSDLPPMSGSGSTGF